MMSAEPRSIGGVLDDSIRLYRHTLKACLPIVFIGLLLATPPGIWITLHAKSLAPGDTSGVLGLFTSPLFWLLSLVSLVIYTLTYGALIHQIDAMAHGRRLTLTQAIGLGVQRLPALLGVSILFGLAVLAGTVALLIPGVWLWGLLQFAVVATIVERSGVIASLATSRRLVTGNWWRANVVVFVAFVLMMVLVMVLGAIGGVIMAMSGLPVTSNSVGAEVATQVISGVVNLFTTSFFPCVLLAVFNDLKLRKDGTDLLNRVGALNPAG